MTTKDFNRQFSFYLIFSEAVSILTNNYHLDRCFRVTGALRSGVKFEFYVPFPEATPDNIFSQSFQCLYYDSFTVSDMKIQLRYFHSFYNRCSNIQRKKIESDPRLKFLVDLG